MDSHLHLRYKEYERGVQQWLDKLALRELEPDREHIDRALSITREHLKLMDAEEISEEAFLLSQYAVFLQQQENKCKAFLTWAQNQYRVLNQADTAKLNTWAEKIQLRITRISYMSMKIEKMAQYLSNLSYNRRKS